METQDNIEEFCAGFKKYIPTKNVILSTMQNFPQEWMKNVYAIHILNEWKNEWNKNNNKKSGLNYHIFPTFLFNFIPKNLWDDISKDIINTLFERSIASGICECDIKFLYLDENADDLCFECEKRQQIWKHRKSPETIQEIDNIQKNVIEWMNMPERNLITDKPIEIMKRFTKLRNSHFSDNYNISHKTYLLKITAKTFAP